MIFAAADKAQANNRVRSIKNAASKASNRLQDDGDDAVATIFDAATSIRDDVEALAENTGRRMREVIDRAEMSVTEISANTLANIRENAVQSSLIALGVGALVGFLLRGSSRSR